MYLIVKMQTGAEVRLVENGNTPSVGDAAVTIRFQDGSVADLILTDDGL